jgi:hypothetical protein
MGFTKTYWISVSSLLQLTLQILYLGPEHVLVHSYPGEKQVQLPRVLCLNNLSKQS